MGGNAAQRSKSARERVREEQRRERVRAQRRKLAAIIIGATVFIVAVVGVGYWVMNRSDGGAQYDGDLAPQTVQDDGSVVMAQPDAEAPVVEVYADFQCPVCAEFEATNAGTLNEMAADGEAIVHFRPVSIFALREAPLSLNSLRGGAAARAAADHGVFVEYSTLLWENQPAEGSEGFSPEQLQEWGAEAGIEGEAHTEFSERVDAESDAAQAFADYAPQLITTAQEQLSEEEFAEVTASVGELLRWGAENGQEPPAELDGTYVQQILDATAAVDERYGEGDDAFTGTPAIYVNGRLVEVSDAMTTSGLREAVTSAEPGDVDTEPLNDTA